MKSFKKTTHTFEVKLLANLIILARSFDGFGGGRIASNKECLQFALSPAQCECKKVSRLAGGILTWRTWGGISQSVASCGPEAGGRLSVGVLNFLLMGPWWAFKAGAQVMSARLTSPLEAAVSALPHGSANASPVLRAQPFYAVIHQVAFGPDGENNQPNAWETQDNISFILIIFCPRSRRELWSIKGKREAHGPSRLLPLRLLKHQQPQVGNSNEAPTC